MKQKDKRKFRNKLYLPSANKSLNYVGTTYHLHNHNYADDPIL